MHLCIFPSLLFLLRLTRRFHVHFPGNAEGSAESSKLCSRLEYNFLISLKQKEADQNEKVCNSRNGRSVCSVAIWTFPITEWEAILQFYTDTNTVLVTSGTAKINTSVLLPLRHTHIAVLHWLQLQFSRAWTQIIQTADKNHTDYIIHYHQCYINLVCLILTCSYLHFAGCHSTPSVILWFKNIEIIGYHFPSLDTAPADKSEASQLNSATPTRRSRIPSRTAVSLTHLL